MLKKTKHILKIIGFSYLALSLLLVIMGTLSNPGIVGKSPKPSTHIAAITEVNATPSPTPIVTSTPTPIPPTTPTPTPIPTPTPKPETVTQKITNGKLEVHYINVGQGDAILIKAPSGEAMIIDAGNNGDGGSLCNYLQSHGVSKLTVVVGTHPHADHIGGMDDIINSFDVGKIYMPKVSSNSLTFQDVLTAIQRKGLKVTTPTPGSTFNLGNAQFTILAPNNRSYSDLNNYSVVLRMTYGNTSFLFMGDAEKLSENEIINSGQSVDSDVIKVGHHGSDYSSGNSFLGQVSPKYAVISVGARNQYGHPAEATLNRLVSAGAQIYRTDQSGTIIATTDGNKITFDKGSSPGKAGTQVASNPQKSISSNEKQTTIKTTPKSESSTVKKDETVYITGSGGKYHRKGCRYLRKSKTPISLEKAKGSYKPCSVCNPPK